MLSETLLPDIREYSDYLTFQQDGAPAHRARETVELLKKETPDFIPPNLWPPNNPDLNPVDYKIWGKVKVYRTKIRDIEELRQRIVHAWEEFDQLVIGAAIGQWRRPTRLQACVEAKGGHLNTNCSAILIKCRLRTK